MTTEQAFLAAIKVTPDDDAPRLVFSDWLEDNRQLERAEFIRVQCALARLHHGDARLEGLQERQEALLAQHKERWLGRWTEVGTFERGLVCVNCMAEELAALWKGKDAEALLPSHLPLSRQELHRGRGSGGVGGLTLPRPPHQARFVG